MTVGADVLLPGTPEYESARRSQIARFDGVHPRAVARCRVPEDIAHVLASARQQGLHVALRSGGHCFAGRSSTTGIVIDVSAMNHVSISDGTVTVGAGARLADVYDALAAHDLTIAAGCGPTVGIAGLTLGGGPRHPRPDGAAHCETRRERTTLRRGAHVRPGEGSRRPAATGRAPGAARCP
jgi:FAD/FMN-containing dehydrogenase